MNKNILLCGVGGQGIVLASKLIAQAAMENSLPVMSAETIGMAQKGGSVFSHVRIGSNLSTPMIPKGGADVIIGFEPAEAVRMLPYLKKDGTVIVNSCPTKPVTAMLSGASVILIKSIAIFSPPFNLSTEYNSRLQAACHHY